MDDNHQALIDKVDKQETRQEVRQNVNSQGVKQADGRQIDKVLMKTIVTEQKQQKIDTTNTHTDGLIN